MTTATEHRYIVRDDGILGGEPIVTGTRTPVRAIVEMWALSYYADHQAEIQGYMRRNQVPDALVHPVPGVGA